MAEGAPQPCGAPAPPGSTSRASRARPGWEFTDITKLDLAAFVAAAPGEGDASAVDRVETLLEAPEGAHHLGQVDGRVVDGSGDLDDGVIALPLTLACEHHADLVQQHFGTIVDANQNVFTELNDAGWTGGAFIHVARGVQASSPPIVLTAISDAAGTALHRRVLIVLEEGAEAEVWEQHLSGSHRRRDDAQLGRRAARSARTPACASSAPRT